MLEFIAGFLLAYVVQYFLGKFYIRRMMDKPNGLVIYYKGERIE